MFVAAASNPTRATLRLRLARRGFPLFPVTQCAPGRGPSAMHIASNARQTTCTLKTARTM